MFCDQAVLIVKAGNGGNGKISFRHEKYIAKGGPEGGDGGKGGSVIVKATTRKNTLIDYQAKRLWKALDGEAGDIKQMAGRSGEDLILDMPVGTEIWCNGNCIVDLVEDGQEYCIADGGRGGYGNAHFTSSVRQAPKFAERGEIMVPDTYQLELKLVADIGIIGFPSVGKSTLISVISNCRPKIAEYEFTTLIPNLGVVQVGEVDFVVADVPGLIEGAHTGKGLGGTFLRHIERCRKLVHVVDGTSNDPVEKYQIINSELEKYSPELAKKEQILVINKADVLDEEYKQLLTDAFAQYQPDLKPIFISAATHTGLEPLLYAMKDAVLAIEQGPIIDDEISERVIFKPHLEQAENEWVLYVEGESFSIKGKRLEQITNMTDTKNPEGMARLFDIYEKKGVFKELRRAGWSMDKVVKVGRFDVLFVDYDLE